MTTKTAAEQIEKAFDNFVAKHSFSSEVHKQIKAEILSFNKANNVACALNYWGVAKGARAERIAELIISEQIVESAK